MFSDHPDQVHVPVAARTLILGDARVLHSAGRNYTDERRTLILAWHRRATTDVPDYWDGDIPEAIAQRDPNRNYPGSRLPGEHLK